MSMVKRFSAGHAYMHMIEGKRPILVDTGAYFKKEDYLNVFEQEGINPEDIALIILTHGHWDHIAGVHILKELTKAPVLCHRNAAKALRAGDSYDYQPRGEEGKKWFKTFEPHTWQNIKDAKADIMIDDEFDLKPYGVEGRIVLTPGHSDSSISVVLTSGEAIIGDFVMVSPYSGQLILNLIVSDEIQLRASLKKLLEMADTLYDGHGGPYSAAELAMMLESNKQG